MRVLIFLSFTLLSFTILYITNPKIALFNRFTCRKIGGGCNCHHECKIQNTII